MAKTNYAFTNFGSDTAKAYGSNLDISTKVSINICNWLRGLPVDKAITKLENVLAFKEAVPFTRFTDGVGHRKGKMASGRYPQKASKAFLALLNSAVSNAANLGLSDDLKIIHLVANKASTPLHQGRQRRRAMKKTHLEVVLKEVEVKTKASSKKLAKNVSNKNISKNVSVEKKESSSEKKTVDSKDKTSAVSSEDKK